MVWSLPGVLVSTLCCPHPTAGSLGPPSLVFFSPTSNLLKKEFLGDWFCFESHFPVFFPGTTRDFPAWGSGKETENLQGIGHWGPVGFDYRTSTGLGKWTPGGHKQKFVCTRRQEKGAVSLQETETDLPVTVKESPDRQFGLRPTKGREHSSTHQQKIGLKIYWAWPRPSE